ncbi:MAG: cell division protein ZapA [bacterium]|nr:cell division protein ZapA [bacterium]
MSVSRTVTLHGIRVPLRTELEDAELDAAVLMVRERMELVSRGATHREPAIVAALAALNLAGEMLRREEGAAPGSGALDVLSKRIEDHLRTGEDTGG